MISRKIHVQATPRITFSALTACALLFVAGMSITFEGMAPNAAVGADTLPAAPAEQVDFVRHIQPIFKATCHVCHGPDEQEGGLRLDVKARALSGGDDGPVIVPRDGAASRLVQLVAGTVDDKRMPPPDEGKPLSPEQVALLRAWIDQGAVWPDDQDAEAAMNQQKADHWSFQPILDPLLPKVKEPGWVANGIDAFVLARLEQASIPNSPPAPRRALIRRLYLDMLGIPPTPEEVDRFVADQSNNAYTQLVEHVLGSPHYGERWARHWLDIVRFAESHGYERNVQRPNAWPYRDYVITAFNSDLPYDRFVLEQLAGDSVGSDVATGFLVAGPHDLVKSQNKKLSLMQRANELADIANATGTTFLGLTLGCARCHSHKFDPITQRDFYSFEALLSGVQHGERKIAVPDSKELASQAAVVKERITAIRKLLEPYKIDKREPVNAVLNADKFAARLARFVRFSIEQTNDGGQPILDELEVFSAGESQNVALPAAGAKLVTSAGDYTDNPLRHKPEYINDGKYGDLKAWISKEKGKGWIQIELAQPTMIDRVVWSRDREKLFTRSLPTHYQIEVAEQPGRWTVVASSEDRLPFDAAANERLRYSFQEVPAGETERLVNLVEELRELADRHTALTAERDSVYAGRFEQPDVTHRLYRGDPEQPREQVVPATLSAMEPVRLAADAAEQQRRIALADWIVGAARPLSARVMANRIWQYHFGTGIVATPSDFGRQGTPPSHPELLDWLASRFVEGNWSIKHMHRLILNSNTYRQSSLPGERGMAADAQARLLWRFPPRRLEAEPIRDTILFVSGALNTRIGGPSFDPFWPTQHNVRIYVPAERYGPAECRRMVYIFKARMETDPVFGVFDRPDGGLVCPKRSRSTTPLQAYNLFNSRFVLEQSERFARRIQREAGQQPADQVRQAYLIALGRPPDASEADISEKLLRDHGLAALCRVIFNTNEFLFML